MLIDIRNDRSERVKYDYADFPIYIRESQLSIFPNYAADSHWHDDIELIYVKKGHMLYNVNGDIVRINEGEGIFVNSKELHYGFSDDKTECIFICILFHYVLLCSSKSFEKMYIKSILNSGLPYIHLSKELLWQDMIIECICNINDKKTEPLFLQGQLCLLWNELVKNMPFNNTENNHGENMTSLKKMVNYIYEHYEKKLTLEDIAKVGGISKRSCGSLFTKYLNKSPIEFLIDYRLRKSIELMERTDLTILEICLSVGFSGASYYAEIFRKQFGKSPSEYRKIKYESK